MANAFSEHNPNLQLAWDASSLKSLQFCPRHYQYNNLQGWQSESVDLLFGRHFATGMERYQKFRLDGKSREDAIVEVIRLALEETYHEGGFITEFDENTHEHVIKGRHADTQEFGRYETMWKCNGDSKEVTGKRYKNAKGNAAKCPFAHEKMWFPDEAPSECGECGGTIRVERRYISDHRSKHRPGLIRALIWYGLEQPEDLMEGYHPYVFPDGTPAVELSGRVPLPAYAPTGEQYILTYNFDYIGEWGTERFITDNKTTTKTLNAQFFETYSPDTQFDTYDLIGSLMFPALDIRGTMVEAAQLLTEGVEIGKHPYYKSEAQREEHFKDLLLWISTAERYAVEGYWPMNKRSCWLCPFKRVCSQSPEMRDGFLKSNFQKQERWNPLRER